MPYTRLRFVTFSVLLIADVLPARITSSHERCKGKGCKNAQFSFVELVPSKRHLYCKSGKYSNVLKLSMTPPLLMTQQKISPFVLPEISLEAITKERNSIKTISQFQECHSPSVINVVWTLPYQNSEKCKRNVGEPFQSDFRDAFQSICVCIHFIVHTKKSICTAHLLAHGRDIWNDIISVIIIIVK